MHSRDLLPPMLPPIAVSMDYFLPRVSILIGRTAGLLLARVAYPRAESRHAVRRHRRHSQTPRKLRPGDEIFLFRPDLSARRSRPRVAGNIVARPRLFGACLLHPA